MKDFNSSLVHEGSPYGSLVVAAFVKEPAALVKSEGQLRRGQELDEASEFREGWLKVIRIIAGGEKQCDVELRHLTRNGTGRVSGLGPTLASVGILEPSPVAGNTTRTVLSVSDELPASPSPLGLSPASPRHSVCLRL